ncbi:DUF6541 family protein [Kineococcus sp. SYSU DK003]|uniref:DUF6541 family protein n=1 Tax=Kineococcus sp. SYSU DK003 TaxID=3383124 RepID=UPI003D7E4B69
MTVITAGTALGDALTTALAVAWVLVPGGAVLLAAGIRSVPLLLGAAPATTIGASTLAATVSGLTGARFSWWLVLAVTAAVAAVAALVRGRAERPELPRGPLLPAGLLVAAAAATACVLFRRGTGTLATPSQEHDTITHTLVVARILRSGDAAPWRGQALDVVTGEPAVYYPNGLHQWAALVAGSGGVDAVSALNATSVVVLAVVQTLGLLALASRTLPPAWLPAGGVAAIASVLAYQPVQAMHHDSGALANAAAIAFAPGVVALLLPPARVTGRAVAGVVPALALACAGAVTVHPSAVLTVAGGFAGWLVFTALLSLLPSRAETTVSVAERGVRRTETVVSAGKWCAGLTVAGLLAGGLVGAALAQAAATGGGSSSRFARDVPPQSWPDALHRVLTLPLQGGIDPEATHEQWWLAVAVVLGALLAGRRAGAVALTWLVWSAVAAAYLVDVHGFVLDLVWDSAWNSYYRIVAHGSAWAWLLAGVAVVRLADLAGRRSAPVVSTVLGLVLLAGAAVESGPTEVAALRERYADPTYQRVDADDLAAARYLADHVTDGERVLNSGNDGSTYAYVLEGVPVLATTAVPGPAQPGLRTLLARFRDLPADAEVARLVEQEDVGWVVVDADAPGLPLKPADAQFFGVPGYAVPPGLVDLDSVPGLTRVFTSGTVGVWKVDVP